MPFIGSGFDDPDISAVHQACRLMQASAMAGLLGAVLLKFAV
jgi:adenosylcobinamide-phosphate synthase